MKYALFTGCVAKGAGRELMTATTLVCKKLGIELVEMVDAACCGAGVISEDNPMIADIVNARTFALAEEQGLNIMNICGTCQGVHRKLQVKLAKDPAYKARVNKALIAETGHEYKGRVEIKHFYEVMLEDFGLDKLKAAVTKPLSELKVAPFYGCYALRPHEYSDLENPDNPNELEKLFETLGCKVVEYSERLKCCGFPILMMNKTNSLQLSGNAILSAKNAGADCLVTPCPLCHLNMDAYQPEIESCTGESLNMPILHVPQLVAMALGFSTNDLKMRTHIVRPTEAVTSAQA
ncbi:Heterodisulfide reductase subunit B-like protein @ Putative succinate dehydrogenase subunit [hydrothermal vent metagenome]|uniref:Heterodisulfide reductase subunit B-like protein @ Putative succinate dehydrogenase subunit n=1 Tax=hydrothermal vent metagenome TaxID=652676 RepID=A0A3B1BSG6_9ZZZZ